MWIVGIVGLAGVVVFGVLFAISVLKGGSLKIPTIGMVVCFALVVAIGTMSFLKIGPFGDPAADSSADPTGTVLESDPAQSAGESALPEESENVEDFDALGDVDVDSGLFNVTLTIPSDYVEEGTTQDQLDATAKEEGYKSATLNADGSVTYVITKAQHREMMDGISQGIDKSLSEMAGSEEYPTISRIEANSDYTEYKVYLNSEEVGFSESMATLGLYIFSGTYHVFNGTEPGNVNIQFLSESTGQVIQEANSNDMQQ